MLRESGTLVIAIRHIDLTARTSKFKSIPIQKYEFYYFFFASRYGMVEFLYLLFCRYIRDGKVCQIGYMLILRNKDFQRLRYIYLTQ